jgi:ABC-2 type transport system ATP-binding protein
MNAPAISARGLTKRFGKTLALDGLDLEVPPRTVLGLLGPAGAGKSTAIRLMAGLAHPSAGTVEVAGEVARAGDGIAARRRLGVVPQDPGLPGWMSVRELLAFAASLSEVSAADVPVRIDAVSGQLGLDGLLDRRVGDLPHPARGRLGIAQALVSDPAVLLLDEPFHPLDPEARAEVRSLLRSRTGRAAAVVATDRIADIEGLCDRVAFLVGSRLRAHLPTEAFLARFAAPVYVVEVDAREEVAFEGLVARLRAEPWVSEAVVLDGALRVAPTDHDRAMQELVPAVVATGLRVGGFRRERPSLEAVVAGIGADPAGAVA